MDGTNLVSGTVVLYLNLYDAAVGGTLLYSDENVSQAVNDGLYHTMLGDGTVFGTLDQALTNNQVWLEVVVNAATLTPRERLVAVPYARAVPGLRVVNGSSIVLNPDHGMNIIQPGAEHSTIGGGLRNAIFTFNATISGGFENSIQTGANYSSIGGGLWNVIQENAWMSTIGGGQNNSMHTNAAYSTIGGGLFNSIQTIAGYATIGGGRNNSVQMGAWWATIGGGAFNVIAPQATNSTISGGGNNSIRTNAQHATIAGGMENIINPGASGSAIAGGALQWIGVGASNTFIGGGFFNYVEAPYSTVAGGRQNQIGTQSSYASILGGSENVIGQNARNSTIGGGELNAIQTNAQFATIGGGRQNSIQAHGQFSAIGGGSFNVIEAALYASIGGGALNVIYTNAHYATITGGGANSIRTNAQYATIAGGRVNRVGANATNAFVAGRQAVANHRGAFVWGDDTNAEITSASINQVTFRASGGYRIFSNSGATLGAQLAANATSWSALSDREAKENVAPIHTGEILAKLAALPLTEWNYRDDPAGRRYIGPMAQDFHAAFGLGDDTTINTLDADGVALAAIQALAQENERLRDELETIKKHLGLMP